MIQQTFIQNQDFQFFVDIEKGGLFHVINSPIKD